ncbi:hypothetical protein RI129_000372 [Pyrocoelia pectoralis]|uniref:Regulatory protein zeste n=1 Tax=Pyrocoelia pectoralis TaxID=417401 RepID=A0AAN7ZVX2_9COLE
MLLLSIISDYKSIIECKKTDGTTWEEKSSCWKKIAVQFNSKSPNYHNRTADSLKKYYENQKKTLRKNIADEKISLFQTGGGENVVKKDPLDDITLSIVNKKTVLGLQCNYGGDVEILQNAYADDIPEPMLILNNEDDHSYTITSAAQVPCEMDTVIINDSAIEEPSTSTQYKITTAIEEKSNDMSSLDWGHYKPGHLSTPINEKLANVCNEKDTGRKNKKWQARRRPATSALPSTALTQNYTDLAAVKLELSNLQLEAFKIDTESRRKREEAEFILKMKILEVDLKIKEATLKSLTQ